MSEGIIGSLIGAFGSFFGSLIGAIATVLGAAIPILFNLNQQKNNEKKQKEALEQDFYKLRQVLDEARKQGALSGEDFEKFQNILEEIFKLSTPYQEARDWLEKRRNQKLLINAIKVVQKHYNPKKSRFVPSTANLEKLKKSITNRLNWISASLENGRVLKITDYYFLPGISDVYRIAFNYIREQIDKSTAKDNGWPTWLQIRATQGQDTNESLSEVAANVLKYYFDLNDEDLHIRQEPDKISE